jgi:hypothetical protein
MLFRASLIGVELLAARDSKALDSVSLERFYCGEIKKFTVERCAEENTPL